MLKYITLAAPYLLRSSRQSSVKLFAGLALAYMFIAMGFILISFALGVWIARVHSLELALIVTGAIMLMFAGIILSFVYYTRHASAQKLAIKKDYPIANILPQSLLEDPTINGVLQQISRNPVAAIAAATAAGVIISRELFNKD